MIANEEEVINRSFSNKDLILISDDTDYFEKNNKKEETGEDNDQMRKDSIMSGLSENFTDSDFDFGMKKNLRDRLCG